MRLKPATPRSRKLVTALLNIINFEFSHIIGNVSLGYPGRLGKFQTSLLSHGNKLHHWHSGFSMIRLALTWVDILLSRNGTKECCWACTGRLICAFFGRNWHYVSFHMTWLISDTSCITARIFSKTLFSTFLFELSKIIYLVRGNHTVRGNQCRKGQ